MNDAKMRKACSEIAKLMAATRPSTDEAAVITLTIAAAVISRIAEDDGDDVETIFWTFVGALAVSFNIDMGTPDGETLQ